MGIPRRGIALLETIVAAALVAVLISVSLQMLAAMASQRRGVEKRAIALQQAANIIERIRSWSWPEITPERLDGVKLGSSVKEILPGAEMKLTVQPTADLPQGKHIRVEISWTNAARGKDSPARLDYWAYPKPGDGSP